MKEIRQIKLKLDRKRFSFEYNFHHSSLSQYICELWKFTGDCVDFEDSLNLTPRQPYNPSLQPDRTILKPSPNTSQLDSPKAVKRKSLRPKLHAADFF